MPVEPQGVELVDQVVDDVRGGRLGIDAVDQVVLPDHRSQIVSRNSGGTR